MARKVEFRPSRGSGAGRGDAIVPSATPEDGSPSTAGRSPAGPPHRGHRTVRRIAGRGRRATPDRAAREGRWEMRVLNPRSATHQAFAGIGATAYDARRVRPGPLRPNPERSTVRVRTQTATKGAGLGAGKSPSGSTATSAPSTRRLRERVAPGGLRRRDQREQQMPVPISAALRRPMPRAPWRLASTGRHCRRTFINHFIRPAAPPGNTLPFKPRTGDRNLLGR